MAFEIFGLNLDQLSAIVFLLAVGLFVLIKWKSIIFQKLVSIPFINIPILYVALYKTKLGLKQMDSISSKFREFVKLFGYISIGVGFTIMVFITISIVYIILKLTFQPVPNQPVMALVLPLTNVPGAGYLPFWYWILALFIIVLMHEFAHGVVARAHGVKIKSSGFAIFGIVIPVVPAAFVEPDEAELKKQSDVVQYSVFAAGPGINIFFALILIILLPYTFVGGLAPYENHFTQPVGVSVNLINETLPAAKAGILNKTLITEMNGYKINDVQDFMSELGKVKPGEEVNLTANGTVYHIQTIPNPSNNRTAFLGVASIQNERRIVPGRDIEASVYYWIKDFLKWLVALSLGIGMINLMPIPIADGGRMFQTAVGKTVKNKERARKIWLYVGIFLLLILLLGLLITYKDSAISLIKNIFS